MTRSLIRPGHLSVSVGEKSDALFRNFCTQGCGASIRDSLRLAQSGLIETPHYSDPFF